MTEELILIITAVITIVILISIIIVQHDIIVKQRKRINKVVDTRHCKIHRDYKICNIYDTSFSGCWGCIHYKLIK